jgi:hypothetical protein
MTEAFRGHKALDASELKQSSALRQLHTTTRF